MVARNSPRNGSCHRTPDDPGELTPPARRQAERARVRIQSARGPPARNASRSGRGRDMQQRPALLKGWVHRLGLHPRSLRSRTPIRRLSLRGHSRTRSEPQHAGRGRSEPVLRYRRRNCSTRLPAADRVSDGAALSERRQGRSAEPPSSSSSAARATPDRLSSDQPLDRGQELGSARDGEIAKGARRRREARSVLLMTNQWRRIGSSSTSRQASLPVSTSAAMVWAEISAIPIPAMTACLIVSLEPSSMPIGICLIRVSPIKSSNSDRVPEPISLKRNASPARSARVKPLALASRCSGDAIRT